MSLKLQITKKLSEFSIDIDVNITGKRIGLVGASGSGKSFTLRCICGLEKPDEGKISYYETVFFDSMIKTNISAAKRKIGLVLQNYALFPHMSVEANLTAGLVNITAKQRKYLVRKRANEYGIGNFLKKLPGQLSGGQQQRIALLRALLPEPDMLLLDEPLSALDPHTRRNMLRQLDDDLSDYTGIVIMVSHDLDEIYSFCDQIIIIDQGRIIEAGNCEQVIKTPHNHISAELCGIENISPLAKIEEGYLLANKWNIVFESSKITDPDSSSFVGIKAKNIEVLETTHCISDINNDEYYEESNKREIQNDRKDINCGWFLCKKVFDIREYTRLICVPIDKNSGENIVSMETMPKELIVDVGNHKDSLETVTSGKKIEPGYYLKLFFRHEHILALV